MDNSQTNYVSDFFNSPEEHMDYLLTPKPINVRDTITPYLYVIKSKTLDAYYVGIRYSIKESNPSKFWVNYQTSSKEIKEAINLYGSTDFEVINVFDTDPHGNDWDFQSPTNDSFRIGQFETDSIKLLESFHSAGIRLINQKSKFGDKTFNRYAILPDGRTAGDLIVEKLKNKLQMEVEPGVTLAQQRSKKSATTMMTTEVEPGVTIAQQRANRVAELMSQEVEPGVTRSMLRSENISKSLNTVTESGLTVAQLRGKEHSITQNTEVEPGLTLAQKTGKTISIALNREIEPGVTVAQQRNRRVAELMKQEVSPGVTRSQLKGQKIAEAKFKRTIHIYDGNELLHVFKTRKDLLKHVPKSHVNKIVNLYDNGGGILNVQDCKFSGLYISLTPINQS